MSRLVKNTRGFIIETKVFVAAIKPFAKVARKVSRDTNALSLLIRLITDEQIELVGNTKLVNEYSA